MKRERVCCTVPNCNGIFNSLEEFREHYIEKHVKDYGPFMFGCHPIIYSYEYRFQEDEEK